ncbi:MAG TPA: isochorismatase family protein [Iamia sp.]|nr:isochorismatase family protein [Iamia sp.]
MTTVAGTTPYAWPWDGVVDPARLALVVAGHDAGWSGRSDPALAAVVADRLAALAGTLLGAGVPVLAVAHRGSAPLGDDDRVDVVRAAGIDGFYGSDLDARLRAARRDHLVVAGFGLEGPVHSTLRAANDRGYECLLLADASAPLDPALAPAARSMVEMSGGIFGAVGATAALLAALPPAPSPEVHP